YRVKIRQFDMDNITITSQGLPDAAALRDLFVSVRWGKAEQYDLGALQASLEGMSRVYSAYEDGKLVGVARVLSDGQTVAQIIDVVVSPSRQKRGIGRSLVKVILEEYSHTAIYADAFEENEKFFRSCG